MGATPETEKARADIIRLDFAPSGQNLLELRDLSEVKQATKNRIVKAGLSDYVVCSLNFAKEKLRSLKKSQSEKQGDIRELLLGSADS